MNHPSFWESESFRQPCDLIIIGAGLVGLSSALFYKQTQPDARVMVLERGLYPRGASTRNAGFACIGSIGEHLADLNNLTEAEVKNQMIQRFNGLLLLKQTLGEEAIGYEACGGYELFRSQKDIATVKAEITRFNNWMEELAGESSVYGARELNGYPVIYNRLEGSLHTGKMMQQLIQKVTRAGVEIRWNCPVQQTQPDGHVMLAGGAVLKASQVLLAVNGFASQLLPKLNIRPARGLVLMTNKLKELPWKGTFHHDRGYIYFRNVGDQLLIGGARNAAFEEEQTVEFGINEKVRKRLIRFTSEVLNLPADWHIEREWSGIMGFSSDKTPIVRRVDGHRFVAAGLSGIGIAIGMKIGKSAVALLEDK